MQFQATSLFRSEKFPSQKCKPILNDTSVKEPLEKLQHDFAVALIENTVNNLPFLCKMFDATTVLKEFGVVRTLSKYFKLISNYNKNILIQQLMKSNNIFQCLFLKI